jgi:hypothetical protein
MAKWAIGISASSIGLSWLLGQCWDLHGVALAMVLTETAMALLCTRLVFAAVLHTKTE